MHSTRSASDKVYQLIAHGRWFSPGTPASSTTTTGRHDIAEILLKVALNTKKFESNLVFCVEVFLLFVFILCFVQNAAYVSGLFIHDCFYGFL